MDQASWVELPGLYTEQDHTELSEALESAGVEHESRGVSLEAKPTGAPSVYLFRVQTTQVQPAARVLGEFFDMEDPERAQPYEGDCPACGEPVAASWDCPSCELNFKPRADPRDPVFQFLRAHEGFRAT
jgi:hypothetical protein